MSGDAPELWNEKYPEKITKLYKNSVDAGSDIFLTNSFGRNALRLKLHNCESRAFDLSKYLLKLRMKLQMVVLEKCLLQDQLGLPVK